MVLVLPRTGAWALECKLQTIDNAHNSERLLDWKHLWGDFILRVAWGNCTLEGLVRIFSTFKQPPWWRGKKKHCSRKATNCTRSLCLKEREDVDGKPLCRIRCSMDCMSWTISFLEGYYSKIKAKEARQNIYEYDLFKVCLHARDKTKNENIHKTPVTCWSISVPKAGPFLYLDGSQIC